MPLLTRRVRAAALWLALLGLTLRALLPAGYMPAMDRAGFALVLCTAQGAKTLSPEGSGAPRKSSSHQHECPFGFALSMAAAPAAPAHPAAWLASESPRAQAPTVVRIGDAYRNYRPRAPPAA